MAYLTQCIMQLAEGETPIGLGKNKLAFV